MNEVGIKVLNAFQGGDLILVGSEREIFVEVLY